jgi:2'-deoxynucleoside 5'-phosphate N-hydrolase
MKIFFGKKFKGDFSDRVFIENFASLLTKKDIEMTSIVRDYERWGEATITPSGLMEETFRSIEEADTVLIEFSEKGVGLGMEMGYAYAKGKPVIVIAKEGSDISTTVQGIAEKIVFYTEIDEIPEKLGL